MPRNAAGKVALSCRRVLDGDIVAPGWRSRARWPGHGNLAATIGRIYIGLIKWKILAVGVGRATKANLRDLTAVRELRVGETRKFLRLSWRQAAAVDSAR